MKSEKYKLVFSFMAIIGNVYLVFFIFIVHFIIYKSEFFIVHFSFDNLINYEYRRT